MIEINREKAISLLEQAVSERGSDFIYDHPLKKIQGEDDKEMTLGGCWYELNGAPSCGVGAALHKAGTPIPVLDSLDQSLGDTAIPDVAWILEDHGVHLTQEALRVFETFQGLQDLNYTWGTALEAAKKED